MKHPKPLTNIFALCLCLGWQGGTIYQICDETGLSQNKFFELENLKITDTWALTSYNAGAAWVVDFGLSPRDRHAVPIEYRGNVAFFAGAVDAVKRMV